MIIYYCKEKITDLTTENNFRKIKKVFDKQPKVCYNKGTVKKKVGEFMRTPKDWVLCKPYPQIKQLVGKALERRRKCLTKPRECDIIKRKMK